MTVASGASSHVWLKIPDWWVKTESEQPWGSETRPPGATGPGSQRSASAPKSRWPGAGGGGWGHIPASCRRRSERAGASGLAWWGATTVGGDPPAPARRGPWEAAAVNSPCLGMLQGVTWRGASPGGAAVFGAIPRGVGAPGHTWPLAVDVAASGWTRAASVLHPPCLQVDSVIGEQKRLRTCRFAV